MKKIVFVALVLSCVSVWMLSRDDARILPVPLSENVTAIAAIEELDIRVFWPSQHDPNGSTPTGLAIGPEGALFVLHRAGRPFGSEATLIPEPLIVKLDAETGQVIKRYGAGIFANPHGLDVGPDGSIWVTDVALNAVFHLDKDGKLIRRYGATYPVYLEPLLRIRNVLPRLPVPMDESTFARPTDVAPLKNGRFAVTDGYRNSRLAVFEQDGTLVWQVNQRGSAPGAFHLPHGLASDRQDRLYVADRRNARIQIFGPDGTLLAIIASGFAGRPFGLDISDGNCLYIADGGDQLDETEDIDQNRPRAGFAVLTLSGKSHLRGEEWGSDQSAGRFSLPHDIAVTPGGRAFIADLNGDKVQTVRLPINCDD